MNTAIDKITVEGREYVPSESIKQPNGNIKIVILQRGWIMVGYFTRNGNDCKLEKSSVIRTWGTTKGLGEIALGGPTSNTKLDKNYGIVQFDYLTVVAMVDCEESKWKNAL